MDFSLLLKEIIVKVIDYLTGFVSKIITDFFSALTGKEPVD